MTVARRRSASSTDEEEPVGHRRTLLIAAVAGAVGILVYIGGWALAGVVLPGYDPLRDAISETFALGVATRWWMTAILVVTGLALVLFGWVIEHGLPGEGRAGPIAAVVAGIGTIGAALAPCSSGCPGFGTTVTDTLHVVAAGTGYLALIAAPLLVAVRVRPHLPGFARWSLLLGGLALLGFVVRNLGVGDALGGLQQRTFNTLADLWYLVAAGVIVQRIRRRGRIA